MEGDEEEKILRNEVSKEKKRKKNQEKVVHALTRTWAHVLSSVFHDACTHEHGSLFLDAPSHFYKRSCPSVRWSVGPSVGPVLFSKMKKTHTRRILCRVSGLVTSSIALCTDF